MRLRDEISIKISDDSDGDDEAGYYSASAYSDSSEDGRYLELTIEVSAPLTPWNLGDPGAKVIALLDKACAEMKAEILKDIEKMKQAELKEIHGVDA